MAAPTSVLRNRPLLTLMYGHFTVDMYVGLLPVLYPLLTDRFSLDLKAVGLVSLAYSGVAALSQPFFGWIADRYGTRFAGLALIWTAIMFATIGFAPTFPILLLLAGLAGLGSGCYHPMGALNANAVIPEKQRNVAMSVYVTGGTTGVALGPLIGAVLFTVFGIHGTALMLFPGIGGAIWLLFEMRKIAIRRPERAKHGAATTSAPVPILPLIAIIAVMASRSWTVIGIEAFIPTWYKSLGYSASFYGPLATTVVIASALGTIGSGQLADRYGRRAVIIGGLVFTVPFILLFAQFTGPIAFVTGAAVGALAASTGPLMLVMAQQLMAGRAGMASGLILGLGFVTGAVGVPITGAMADAWGIPNAIRFQVIVVLATILIARLLPSEQYFRDHAAATARHTGPAPVPATASGDGD
jgi:FSR family fosmidomycin resistance protein-like MFS transporter